MTPRVVVFDFDETLAESKQPLTPRMASLMSLLLERAPVAIASGGKLEILHENGVDRLPEGSRHENLYLLPTCGAALYAHRDGSWDAIYAELLSEEEGRFIREAIESAIRETSLIDLDSPSHGERIEFRGSQVTLSALGQSAPIHEKKAWDPDRVKRPVLRDAIARLVPGFDVKTGGATSFDITKPGINKAFGIRKLSEHVGIPISEMLYVGDALFPGGNDEIVIGTGIATRQTSGPEETERIIEELLG